MISVIPQVKQWACGDSPLLKGPSGVTLAVLGFHTTFTFTNELLITGAMP